MKKVSDEIFTKLADLIYDGTGENLYGMTQEEALSHITDYIVTLEYTVDALLLNKKSNGRKYTGKSGKTSR